MDKFLSIHFTFCYNFSALRFENILFGSGDASTKNVNLPSQATVNLSSSSQTTKKPYNFSTLRFENILFGSGDASTKKTKIKIILLHPPTPPPPFFCYIIIYSYYITKHVFLFI